jgi:DNA-binding NtrC family response regulator
MLNILVVPKEDGRLITALLGGHSVDIFDCGEGEPLLQKIARNHYDTILLEKNSRLLQSIKAADPRAEVILLGGEADAVEAVRKGAAAYFPGLDPEGIRKSIDAINELVEVRRETAELEKELFDKYTFAGVVGRNPRMLDIFNFLRRIAPYFKAVTVMGETGTGKEEIAKALHSISPAGKSPFIACNCGGLVENLVESEFFGHVKGSFTGAVRDKVGIFESAADGVVFLDEIGDLPLSFQPHLLRVLQNGEFRPVGGGRTLKARCRIISATNKDLAHEVKEGRFREDLFFRLTPLTILTPALRERKDDIILLSKFLLKRFCQRTDKRILGISRAAQGALISYDWPGNVRELDNVIEQAAIMTQEPFIRLEDLPGYVRESGEVDAQVIKPLREYVKSYIETVLRRYNGNRTYAAKALGISRRALLRKISAYSIESPAKSAQPQ